MRALIEQVLGLGRTSKAGIMLACDLLTVWASFHAALALRLSGWPSPERVHESLPLLILTLALATPLWLSLGLHRVKLTSLEPTSLGALATWVLSLCTTVTALNAWFELGAPRTVPVILAFVLTVAAVGSRFVLRLFLSRLEAGAGTPVAIYGAGRAGHQLVSALRQSGAYRPVAFVDDKAALHGLTVYGLPVVPRRALAGMASRGEIARVFLAIPSLGAGPRKRLLASLGDIGCAVLELPSYLELIRSGGGVEALRPVAPEDLLGRERVELDLPDFARTYGGSCAMVTGAGGSIGSELCRKLLTLTPRTLVLFEHSEFALYAIERELRPLADAAGVTLVPVLGSVTDRRRLALACRRHGVEVMFHAAAYKHVPLVEANEIEGVANNVLGTLIAAEVAIAERVRRFILVSTDKAVRPTNVMGASKRMAEMAVQDCQRRSRWPDGTGSTVFAIVRFGNVLGSSGSVVPLFREQIRLGGPVTVTHPEVTRYFMTIPEAARLVMLAGAFAEGGEVYVLDMGEPVRIVDLARRMIELSGLKLRDEAQPDGDIDIAFTGLHPGEKLYEELLIGGDTLPTPHPRIVRAREDGLSPAALAEAVARLRRLIATDDAEGLRGLLSEHVAGFAAPCGSGLPRVA